MLIRLDDFNDLPIDFLRHETPLFVVNGVFNLLYCEVFFRHFIHRLPVPFRHRANTDDSSVTVSTSSLAINGSTDSIFFDKRLSVLGLFF